MSLRRTVLACAVTFVCALAVFTLPRVAWNTAQAALGQQPVVADSVSRTPTPSAPTRSPQAAPRSLGQRLTGVFGIALILGLGLALSRHRRAISWRVVAWGVGLQLAFAIFVLQVTVGQQLFSALGDAVKTILGFSYVGSEFVFGEIGKQHSSLGIIFAFQVLPAIIFVSALFAILYYLGVMQLVVKAFAIVMNKVMGASGAESLNVAASIFMGQTEAPLTIRPFLPAMTQSELMTVMTAGMAHVSGSIMAAYIAFGIEARHLLTAVIMTAPGTIMMAKMLVPETEQPKTMGVVHMENVERDSNFLAAIARGTSEGLGMAVNVGAMLVAFLALIALTNGIMGGIHHWVAWFPTSLQQIFGWAFAPVAWIIGVPWHDCVQIGNLLGTRMVVNELLAFSYLGPMKGALDPRSFTIATFALCGFANFSSIGMQIGGIGALAPNQRDELAKLGIRAMLAGTMANLMSASIVGIFT